MHEQIKQIQESLKPRGFVFEGNSRFNSSTQVPLGFGKKASPSLMHPTTTTVLFAVQVVPRSGLRPRPPRRPPPPQPGVGGKVEDCDDEDDKLAALPWVSEREGEDEEPTAVPWLVSEAELMPPPPPS